MPPSPGQWLWKETGGENLTQTPRTMWQLLDRRPTFLRGQGVLLLGLCLLQLGLVEVGDF